MEAELKRAHGHRKGTFLRPCFTCESYCLVTSVVVRERMKVYCMDCHNILNKEK